MEKIKFSIAIPAYKSKYLRETIVSCLSQTYNNFEVIVVDDCSPNDIKNIVNSFSDNRIRYYRNEKNCGAINVVDNWNICLKYVTGDWVICMGDDDILAENTLAEYIKLIEKYPHVNLMHSRTIIIDESGEPIYILPDRIELESCLSYMYEKINENRLQFIGDFCFRVSVLRKKGGFYKLPLAWGSDDISTYLCADNGIANTNTPTFYYRSNQYTISSTGSQRIKLDAINREIKWIKDFLDNYIPEGIVEELTLKMLRDRLSINYFKKKANTMSYDIFSNPMCVFHYWWNRKHYQINNKMIMLGIFTALQRLCRKHC